MCNMVTRLYTYSPIQASVVCHIVGPLILIYCIIAQCLIAEHEQNCTCRDGIIRGKSYSTHDHPISVRPTRCTVHQPKLWTEHSGATGIGMHGV